MTVSAVEECTLDHVVQALNRRKSPGPASVKQIREALPKHLKQCDDALAAAVQQGLVWKYGIVRKSYQFWTEAPADFAARLIETKLRQTPGGMTQAALAKIVGGPLLHGVIEPREFIASLVSQGRLFVQPKIGKSGVKYTLDPYDFVDRLVSELVVKMNRIVNENGLVAAAAMDRALALLSRQETSQTSVIRHSVAETSSITAIPSQSSDEPVRSDAEIGELILQAMREIEPRVDDGDLVLISELRQRLDFQQIEKSRFDRILLNLFVARRVVLSKTSAGLASEAERQEFVADEEGNFYNTVALWRA